VTNGKQDIKSDFMAEGWRIQAGIPDPNLVQRLKNESRRLDSGCPTATLNMWAMNMRNIENSTCMERGDSVAQFGNASLILQSDGKYRLDGGSRDDHAEAREWASLFLHEAVIHTFVGAEGGWEAGAGAGRQ
jgi:hypothetical protein